MSAQLSFTSRVLYPHTLSALPPFSDQDFLLFDQQLLVRHQEFINKFKHRLGVVAGEELKSLAAFPDHLSGLLARWPQISRRHSRLVVFGGGSLGDFGGFVASILKRGVRLIHIPSTWLAAVDSAHGGKTALNVKHSKNQVGTFYPAETIFVVKEVLQQIPLAIRQQALGEFVKMSLIGRSQAMAKILQSPAPLVEQMWSLLKPLINDKYTIVKADPWERRGRREVLNFGHTVGHVLESYCRLSHGESVMQGVFFALNFSRYHQLLAADLHEKIMDYLLGLQGLELMAPPAIPEKDFMNLLRQDKKTLGAGRLSFVYLQNIGRPVVSDTDTKDVVNFAKLMGWVKA